MQHLDEAFERLLSAPRRGKRFRGLAVRSLAAVAGVHEHLMFGDGEMDFPPILQALAEMDYAGPVNVELSRHSHCAPEAAAEAYWYLAPRIDAAKSVFLPPKL